MRPRPTPLKAALLVMAILVLGASGAALADMDNILIDNSKVLGALTRPPVAFPHVTHMSMDCLDCHHRMQKGKNVQDAGSLEEKAKGVRCQDCHAVTGSRFAPDLDPTKTALTQSYHKMCLGCHQKLGATGKKPGPRTCAGCHKKGAPVAKK